ncbi:MAG: hypothetical protein FWB90_08365 [Fibromonadales bacterium]|nr:hypothetical protein [Fibromonadales bacterium]
MKTIFSIYTLAVIFFFCGFILLRFSVKNFLLDRGVENKFTDIIIFDKENFGEENEQDAIFINAVKKKLQITAGEQIFQTKSLYDDDSKIENRLEKFYAKIKGKIESYTKNLFPFRKLIVQVAFFVDFYFGNKILPNNVIDLGDGYLTEPTTKGHLTNIDAFVQKMSHLKHILDSIGIPLIYAQYPYVICSEDNISKTGKDQNMQAKDELVKKLKNIDIIVIDLHKEIHQRANDYSKEFHHSLFYKTDHHWTAKTAILAGQIISEKLNYFFDFGLKTELLDTANFTEIFAKKWLGSMGGKVIPLYPKEDFYIYTPKYATDINWLLLYWLWGYDNKLFESNGNFDSIYNFLPEPIDNLEVHALAYPRFSFSRNGNLPDGKKILIIGDSFNNSLSKFLALIFKEVNFIYRRSSLLDDYLVNKPDVVIIGFDRAAIMEPLNTLLF